MLIEELSLAACLPYRLHVTEEVYRGWLSHVDTHFHLIQITTYIAVA